MITELVAALHAFDIDLVADPVQRPDGPTEDDVPQLLGILAAVVDLKVVNSNLTAPQRLIEFHCGYSIVVPERAEYNNTLTKRGAFTALLSEFGPLPGAHIASVLKS